MEIQTKALPVSFPFIIGVLFFNDLFLGKSSGATRWFFFIGMVVFDMATTAINNYMDFKKPNRTSTNMKKNIIGQSGVSPQLVRNMIFRHDCLHCRCGCVLDGSNRLALPCVRRNLSLHRDFSTRMDRFRYPACP